MITLIMSDEGEILASETFETDYLSVAIDKYSDFLNTGGFVLPGPLGFKGKAVSEEQRDTYQEILQYYNNNNEYGNIDL